MIECKRREEKMVENLKSYLPAVFLLIVGWLLGLITTKFTFKQTRELEKRKILREKIEELAKLTYKIKQEYTQIRNETRTNKVVITKSGVSTGINLKNINDASKSIEDAFPLLYLLINFYFHELKSEYNELLNKKEEINKSLAILYLGKDEERCKAAEKINDTVKNIETIYDSIIFSSKNYAQALL
jgi:hypothetical protein